MNNKVVIPHHNDEIRKKIDEEMARLDLAEDRKPPSEHEWLTRMIDQSKPYVREDLEGVEMKSYQMRAISQVKPHFELLCERAMRGDPKAYLEWHLKLIYHFGQTFYRLNFNAGQSVPINVNQYSYQAVGKEFDAYLGLDDWVRIFSVALILQDYNGVFELCQMDEYFIDKDIHTASSNDKQFDKAMLRLLKGVMYPDADMDSLLKDAAEKVFQPEAIGRTRRNNDQRVDEVQYRYLPIISLIHAMFCSQRETLYPEKLKSAVEDHKAFWGRYTRPDEITDNDIDGSNAYNSEQWIAWLITGLASLAYHRWGLEPSVDTFYVPEWMVKGDISKGYKSKAEVFGDDY
ncbi:Imm49 family immunity protein [Vibrio sp. S9_S30]|uniref:Imm49 family immunity protein n=1 Tax=Vibrio sp. S9_S30 TaxID=2720226 RepID=UPI001EEE46A8|nr:Imm49 family immunity protein [Vibrio sp. S9_S30]